MKRPSYLKKQKEQQRRAKAAGKLEARRARKRAKAERAESGDLASPADEMRELPYADDDSATDETVGESPSTEPDDSSRSGRGN